MLIAGGMFGVPGKYLPEDNNWIVKQFSIIQVNTGDSYEEHMIEFVWWNGFAYVWSLIIFVEKVH